MESDRRVLRSALPLHFLALVTEGREGAELMEIPNEILAPIADSDNGDTGLPSML
jgi:hypothetical protein